MERYHKGHEDALLRYTWPTLGTILAALQLIDPALYVAMQPLYLIGHGVKKKSGSGMASGKEIHHLSSDFTLQGEGSRS